MVEIITNSDLQNFGLEAVGKWFIFCYFSTGRKYPAVVYGSYIGGLINHIELITWELAGRVYLPMGGGGCVLLLPAWTGKNRSEWLLGVQGYIRLWVNGWKRSEGLLWLLSGIYRLFLLPMVRLKCGESVVEI